jgi:hypothetical protein
MTHRMYWALVASVSVAALMLAANETFARSGAAARAGFTPTPSRAAVAHSFRHHPRIRGGAFWPTVDDGFYYEPSNGEPVVGAAPPASNDVRYTSTYDVPWDWAHRYPPAVAPSDRPYVSGCSAETVTVPGRGGTEQTVNVTRCY